MVAKLLFAISAVVFIATGLVYLVVPGLALGIVDIEPTPDTEFLLRTEGVALERS